MPKAVFFQQYGGPDVLQVKDVPVSEPQNGEVLIRHKTIGVNFLDVQMRQGLYKSGLPCIPGFEACGVIEKLGPQTEGFKVGERVAYATLPVPGAYQEMRCIDVQYLIKVPERIDDQTAAAVLLKGLTAHYLLRRVFIVRSGHAIVIHAAAGGVGRMMSRWANAQGALVIGTVGSDDKKQIADEAGCHLVVNHTDKEWPQQVRDFTQGIGVNAVYDSIGKDTFRQSLECLMTAGIMVSFGQSSGPIPPFDMALLRAKSLFLTAPKLFDYKTNRMELLLSADKVFDAVLQKVIIPFVYKTYPLIEAAAAHEALESRGTTGSLVLKV